MTLSPSEEEINPVLAGTSFSCEAKVTHSSGNYPATFGWQIGDGWADHAERTQRHSINTMTVPAENVTGNMTFTVVATFTDLVISQTLDINVAG